MATEIHDRICNRPACRVRATHERPSGGFYCDAHRQFDWTDERIEDLKRLDAEGLSAKQISKHFGGTLSRSAVIGKLHRLGVTNPERIRRRQIGHDINGPKRKPRPLIKAAPKIAAAPRGGPIPYKPRLIAVPDNARPVALADLGRRQCRWPLDDPGPGEMERTLFCAAPADGIYCACHSRVAFNPIPSKGPRSADELARSLRKYA